MIGIITTMLTHQLTWLLITLTGTFLFAALAPWLHRRAERSAAPILALLPLATFAQLLAALPAVRSGETAQVRFDWAPALGLSLTFTLDGLGLVMGLLIAGVGTLVVLYAGTYLHGHPALGRFYAIILLFMTAMLGIALSGNALLLFVFWELTSITSFLLIGFEHERAGARAAAWQALLVTGGGGLALLAGFALLAVITGSFEMNVWAAQAETIRAHPLAPAAFLLILGGAATKSAQFPFHFWLPNAMEAPTPVSAYLHSATMVKAGVFLLARLFPILGGLSLWTPALTTLGLLTLVGAALLALAQTDLKRLLAYTTVSALGMLVFLLGLGTPLALKTAAFFLVTHALYKGALFLAAGSVDHGTGTRDIIRLGGIGRAMPFTATAAGLAALSMAGLPPFLGFLAKELIYETTLEAAAPLPLTALTLLANLATVTAAVWVGWRPFWGRPGDDHLHPHEGTPGLWGPPLLLAFLGLTLGLFPALTGSWLVAPAAGTILGQSLKVKLALWHGLTPMLGLSALTLLLGFGLAALQRALQPRLIALWRTLAPFGPANLYHRFVHSLLALASWQTSVLQNGYLRIYILVIVLTTVVLTAATFFLQNVTLTLIPWQPSRFYDFVLVGIILTATFFATRSPSRVTTIALLGSIGYSIALIFLLYSAPDLAMVQFAIETLTVILFVLVLYKLPKFNRLSSMRTRIADVFFALAGGLLMTLLMLLVSSHNSDASVAAYYAANSLAQANGRNIVNVILVDFRGLDTLGEITVLGIAAIGVYSLIRLAGKRGRKQRPVRKGEQTP
ncbi:MAG: putative monovalent cation/H+ antiporter subunit A [Anaerolineales bacterium]|nr:putative monovalent cation/H+ antiporter subunit A [Anaerolineales bacterium]